MTTVVALRANQLRRNKPDAPSPVGEFREDVLTYGAMVYDSLKKRRDFCVSIPNEHSDSRRRKAEECAD